MKYVFIAIIILSIAGNIFLYNKLKTASVDTENFAQLQEQYPLLSKRILIEFPQDILINFLPLRNAIRKQVAGYGDSFAVYFEYLPTGTSIGINEKSEFTAASLFKLPVVMAYYRHKERIQDESDPTIMLTKDMLDDRFGDLWRKGEGYEINLKDAVELALMESDNTAVRALVPEISKADFENVYDGLDIDLKLDGEGALITAKHYSSILKALYFSSVLTKDHSQLILDYLTRTKFADKLPSGIPEGVKVAHKIGVVELTGNEAYMDCGIIYAPRRPYLLCMISKSDEQTARARMGALSATVYDYVSKHK